MVKTNANDLASRMRGAAASPVTHEAPPPAAARRSPVAAVNSDDKTPLSKYTILLTGAESDALEDVARTAKRHIGRRTVAKSDVIRALISTLRDPDVASIVLGHISDQG